MIAFFGMWDHYTPAEIWVALDLQKNGKHHFMHFHINISVSKFHLLSPSYLGFKTALEIFAFAERFSLLLENVNFRYASRNAINWFFLKNKLWTLFKLTPWDTKNSQQLFRLEKLNTIHQVKIGKHEFCKITATFFAVLVSCIW